MFEDQETEDLIAGFIAAYYVGDLSLDITPLAVGEYLVEIWSCDGTGGDLIVTDDQVSMHRRTSPA